MFRFKVYIRINNFFSYIDKMTNIFLFSDKYLLESILRFKLLRLIH